jgi:hypothetical protein
MWALFRREVTLKVASLLGVGAFLSLLSATQVAAAQGYDYWTPEEQEDRIGIEFDWMNTGRPGGGTSNIVTADAFIQVEFNPTLFAVADVPMAFVSAPPDTDQFVFGNPLLGLQWADGIVPQVSLYVGGMIGSPVNANPSQAGFLAAERAGSIRAYEGLARFSPRSLPIVVRVGTRLIFSPVYFRIEFAPSIFGPLTPNGEAIKLPDVGEEFGVRSDFGLQTGSTVVLMDQINEVGLRAEFGLYGGVRVQESFVLTGADDVIQFAFEPFIGFEADKKGLIARLGLLMALDSQAGFAFDEGKDRALRLTLGYKFF